jgi:hypothetical protein
MQEIIVDTARGQALSPEAQKINELVREVRVLRECMEDVALHFQYDILPKMTADSIEKRLNDRN